MTNIKKEMSTEERTKKFIKACELLQRTVKTETDRRRVQVAVGIFRELCDISMKDVKDYMKAS